VVCLLSPYERKEDLIPVLICPECKSSNPDNAASCESCSTAFGLDSPIAAAGQNDQRTEVAAPFSSPFSSPLSGAAVAPGFAGLVAGDVIAARYEIIAGIGQGGMGSVYKALDRELDRVIALKTIRPDLASNASILRRFKQEILLARQISHRNVIRIFDFGVADGIRFITMEFVDGEDLKSRLRRRGKLAPDESEALMRQICEGLQAAHAEDVIHRDLKPENILIDQQNHVWIMDFGLARSLESPHVTRTGMLLGTPDYMSPEQARGDHADVRSDVFAAGLIFYELLTGDLPYKANSTVDRLLQRTRERARPPELVDTAIPKRLSEIVMRCLEIDSDNRYQTADEILCDLEGRESSEGARPSPPGLLRAGTMLGTRYRIEAEAGEGGMGKVYRATDLDLGRTVALKVVRSELSSDPQSFERLKLEILLASRVTHRHVLRIYDLGEAGGVRFVSMAWVDGEDLAALIRRNGPLTEDRILSFEKQLCEGLQAAHLEGVIHRDLKPRNILLDSAGNAYISDFGLAETLKISEETHTDRDAGISGSPRYMSPEQVQGKAVDQRTDIYSLGLVLYEMATGAVPFNDGSALQTMLQRVTETPKSPKLLNPVLSDKLTSVILRCLERDPARRYQSAGELLDELPSQAVETKPKNRGWIGAVAVALIAILATVLIFFRTRSSTSTLPAPANGKYVAVLPFRPIGSDPNLKYDAEGITEALSSRLSSANGVHPISPTALEKVDLSQPVESIARRVGANLIVRGTIRSEGDRVQVIADIYNVQLRERLWSQSFTGTRQNRFAMEDEIGTALVRRLNGGSSGVTALSSATVPATQNADAYDLYLKGRGILKERRDEKGTTAALDLFSEASRKDPSFALAWTGLADASLEMYRYKRDSFWAEKALAAAREAKTRNDKLPEVHFALGSVYTQMGKNADAVFEIRRALQLEPKSDDGYVRLGRAHLQMGQHEAALAAFRKAVDLNPYYWSNHDQLGRAYYRIGRNQDALREFKRVAELDPANASVHNQMGIIYARQSLWDNAITEFKKAIQLHPSPTAYNSLATAYFYAGRHAEAISMFEKAVEMDPTDPVLVGNLADEYRQAKLKEKAQEAYDRAIQLAYRQLQINPRDAKTLGSLALYHAREGKLAEALEFIRRARTYDASDNQLMYDEAVVYALAGRTQDALTALQRALGNGYSVEEARSDPDLATVRALPRFADLLKKHGSRRSAQAPPAGHASQQDAKQK
jgi:serine/threonine protein kinase/tetratricopeptide (TPR) repeat protein/TolB-like protein